LSGESAEDDKPEKTAPSSDEEDTLEAFEFYRKNNIEEDTKIAETIIAGVAEYTEFQVQSREYKNHINKK